MGGYNILVYRYHGSLSLLLATVYPDYKWLPWKFSVTPHHFWENKENHKKFVEWAKDELGVTKMEDWYKISAKVLKIDFFKVTDDLGYYGYRWLWTFAPLQ